MGLNVGSRLGHYDVTALIGEGGMGQVYQATDTKLNRQVALKILPEAFATDRDRLARFQREAQVLASLNHPGIAAIYGIEEEDDTRALVLELVEGPTLADRIAKGPVPVDEALPIAKQIAEALEAAHEAGVIHRDLKPANIKIREDGTVKVLDFGLAKALDTAPEGDPSQSPTLTAAATQMGVIMGTAAYMSPEQAAGQTADKRSDVWSFGVVLYEMLTSQRLFTGETVSHVLAKVLDRELDFSALPTSTPASIKRLLRRCLERKPKRRLGDVGEMLSHLEEAAATPAGELPVGSAIASAAQPAGWRKAVPWSIAALMTIMAILAVLSSRPLGEWPGLMRSPPTSSSLTRFAITLPASDQLYYFFVAPSVALSADGETMLYVAERDGVRQLYRRPLDQLAAIPIPGTEGARYPFFSPDGEWIGFEVDGALKRMALAGGPPATLYDASIGASDASWGTNDTIVFGISTDGHPLMRVASTGGVTEPVTTLAEGEADHRQPHLLPGGSALLFTVATSGPDRIAVKFLDSGERRILLEGSTPRYVASGHIVFARENALWAVPFDADQRELTGDPVPVLEGVRIGGTGFAQFWVAQNGSLVYLPGEDVADARELVWVDRQGNEELVAAEPRPYRSVRLSPDGGRVVTSVEDPANRDLVIYDLVRDTPTRLTFDPAIDTFPIWTPDGERIVFRSARDGRPNLFWKAADGTGDVERLTTSENAQSPHSFSPDGQMLVFGEDRASPDVGILSMDGEHRAEMLLQTEFIESYGEVSPDGRWIAYTSLESGQPEVYVRPFPSVDDGRWQISTAGGGAPMWGPNGDELFYQVRRIPSAMMVVAVATEPTFTQGIPALVFEGPYRTFGENRGRPFDISPDGQRFLMIRYGVLPDEAADQPDIVVVENWLEELKRLVPTN